jgi:hypothetical protein
MKLTKQRLKEIIKEELKNITEVDRGAWVIERDGVSADEKYLSRGLKWGPQARADVHEFKQEAQGVLRYALESGKIDSGRVTEISTIEEWTKDQARNIFNNRDPDDDGKETPAQVAARVRKKFHQGQNRMSRPRAAGDFRSQAKRREEP